MVIENHVNFQNHVLGSDLFLPPWTRLALYSKSKGCSDLSCQALEFECIALRDVNVSFSVTSVWLSSP